MKTIQQHINSLTVAIIEKSELTQIREVLVDYLNSADYVCTSNWHHIKGEVLTSLDLA